NRQYWLDPATVRHPHRKTTEKEEQSSSSGKRRKSSITQRRQQPSMRAQLTIDKIESSPSDANIRVLEAVHDGVSMTLDGIGISADHLTQGVQSHVAVGTR